MSYPVAAGPVGNQMVDALISGSDWNKVTVSYAFPDSPIDYGYFGEPDNNFGVTTFAMRYAALFTLDTAYGNGANNGFAVEGFTNLNLVAGSHGTADIRIAQSDDPSTAYAYYPGTQEIDGDIWFGRVYNYTAPVAGDYAWHTMMHEIGHALGLKHGHETGGNGAMPFAYDSLEFSIMTYRTFVGDDTSGYNYATYSAPQTFMMADIRALQEMYGADFTTNNGATVYKWTPGSGATLVNGLAAISPGGNTIFATIWDGGGIDTYDLRSYTTGVRVDLRPGSFSVFSAAQLADLNGGPNGGYARGNIFNALQYNGDVRSLIENAMGGSGNDRLTGNNANNSLSGNNGQDVIYGLNGNDTLNGGNGNDSLVGGIGNDRLFGSTGNDRVVGQAGSDQFWFLPGYDSDLVIDFQNNVDSLVIRGFGAAANTVSEILSFARNVGSNVKFDFGGGDILVVMNTNKWNLVDDIIV